MNSIEFKLCAEDRARLDKIIELLGGFRHPDCASCVQGVAVYMDKAAAILDGKISAAVAPATEAPSPASLSDQKQAFAEAAAAQSFPPADDAPPFEVTPPAAPVKPAVTLEQIQKKATQIAAGSADKKAALRGIVNQYAAKVTDLPESSWAAVWDALCALEAR